MNIVLKMQRVFVYGTLKKGQPNHHLISGGIESGDCRVEGVGVTEAKYPLIVTTRYNVPFLLDAPNAGNAVVSGTLRRPNGKKWRKIFFRRERDERIQNLKVLLNLVS